MSLTKGSALNADIMGAFFEEVLRSGFKQDRGMYFTHDNNARFMAEAVGIRQLVERKWRSAAHPDQRLPYIIDPACGSGTFLLQAMQTVSGLIQRERASFDRTDNDAAFLAQNFSEHSPNGWAKDFLYGLDPKFIMAMTAKLNMVLHGDGVAHMFKDDAFKPIGSYLDARLRPIDDSARSVAKAVYAPEMSETFDVVLSNPPFGVTLSPLTRAKLTTTFTLPAGSPTEALFLERAFQLLKPKGRLAVVIPESILNASDIAVRSFILRMFHVKAVVSLPRRIFYDTPTLTSLLFAQKKTGAEIIDWDTKLKSAVAVHEQSVAVARTRSHKSMTHTYESPAALQTLILEDLRELGDEGSWLSGRGRGAGPISFSLSGNVSSIEQAQEHYRALLSSPELGDLVFRSALRSLAANEDPTWHCYIVNEVGYKLSRRGERLRENQLATFKGVVTGIERSNLHLANELTSYMVSVETPTKVADFMARDIDWN